MNQPSVFGGFFIYELYRIKLMINIEYIDDKAYISGENIQAKVVFDCGQCFRFEPDEKGVFSGIVHRKLLYAENIDDKFVIYPVTKAEVDEFFYDFFDFSYDYNLINEKLSTDETLKNAVMASPGMRILNQEPFETLISFIISQNNNIKRIKKIIRELCRLCGKQIGEDLYAFPTAEELSTLTLEELYKAGLGYRAPYIYETTRAIKDGFSLDSLFDMDYLSAKKELLTLKGIGPKVADCILLFAFKKREAFPKDVWMKRVLNTVYGFEPKNDTELVAFASEKFPEFAGLAQQYLFNYVRKLDS